MNNDLPTTVWILDSTASRYNDNNTSQKIGTKLGENGILNVKFFILSILIEEF